MLTVDNLSYSFPQKDLYKKISFQLDEGQHCAFIGTSGSGKSTLIQMIRDPENFMYEGKLEKKEECRIGYVSQFSQLKNLKDLTVFEYIAEEFIRLQEKQTELCGAMETGEHLEELLVEYQLVLDAYAAVGGDDYESNIVKKLNLAQLFKLKDMKIEQLSGGEFKLIQVIREMLVFPDFLIMDEPDVFLDFEHLNALKDLINAHKGTILVITHNRYLLNHCFNKIIHLENMELQEFDGSYLDYHLSLLQKKIELQELAVADTEEIERNNAIIERLREKASFNAEAARGKSLEARVKIQKRLEARRIKEPFVDIKQPNIRLETRNAVEDILALKVSNYRVAFDELLLDQVNFEIGSKDKVALIGANGTGKTTLMRAIYKNDHPGIEIHEDIEPAYLSQVQGEMLKESNTIFEEFYEVGFQTHQQVIEHIAEYGFSEELLHQKIEVLSGGEKNILQLAKVSTTKANLLLLDEPTSHLDTYSQLALEKAISKYDGAVLIISHDFYSVVNCVDYVLYIENQSLRKMSLRKFRKMIYDKHFDKDYLAIEQKKKVYETEIELALKNKDFVQAKKISEEFFLAIGRPEFLTLKP